MKQFITKNYLSIIILSGFLIRVLFYFFGGKVYYGKAEFSIGGDTTTWVTSIINLIEHGTYSVDLNEPTGYFFRPPGYSFFIGLFYLLTGKNILVAYKLIVWAQLLLDTASIYLIYKIIDRVFVNKVFSICAALLYAFYPFSIVWAPVIYAETTSVFFLLLGTWFFVNDKLKSHYFFSGLFIGIATLTRLQIIFFFPAALLAMLFHYRNSVYAFIKFALPFSLAFILSYGLWPIRNFILHDTLMFSQDLSAVGCWDKDIMGFRDYIFSVKTDWDPQMTQIMKDEKVVWPEASFLIPEDSIKLNKVAEMCHDCGFGFNAFMKNAGYRNGYLPEDSSCSEEISILFNELTQNQKQYNKWNYYLWVPLGNLKKCLFKSGLYNPSSRLVNLFSTLLFGFRSILILIGFSGVLFYFQRNKKIPILFNLILLYFVFSYLSLSFVYRNIEMRFLLPADILMLIPAAYFFNFLIEKYFLKKKSV